ncbi:MAG: glutaredoxin [Pseudomonadota bacterium]
MVTDTHVCPSGLKARHLLYAHGYTVEDRPLRTRAEQDAFKQVQDVKTTPQTFIDGVRIGGHDDLRRHLNLSLPDRNATTYAPVIALFATTALMALAIVWNLCPGLNLVRWAEWFLAISMVALSLQKTRDVDGFANGFLGYDLLAQRYVPYAYAYPYLEAFAGLGMMAVIGQMAIIEPAVGAGVGPGLWLMVPAALVGLAIGGIGAVSVFKAVYVEKRDLKCACVGGNSNVPLGFVSLTENVMMVAMGLWMLGKAVLA